MATVPTGQPLECHRGAGRGRRAKQRNTRAEQAATRAGVHPREPGGGRVAKLRQKGRDARWPVRVSKAKPREGGPPQAELAVPARGHKSHVPVGRRHRLVRRWITACAGAHDGARLGA
jgi:transposase, IS5 family